MASSTYPKQIISEFYFIYLSVKITLGGGLCDFINHTKKGGDN
jgi:hypothetical protein